MFFFFFNDTATTEIYTLSLHDALPIWIKVVNLVGRGFALLGLLPAVQRDAFVDDRDIGVVGAASNKFLQQNVGRPGRLIDRSLDQTKQRPDQIGRASCRERV